MGYTTTLKKVWNENQESVRERVMGSLGRQLLLLDCLEILITVVSFCIMLFNDGVSKQITKEERIIIVVLLTVILQIEKQDKFNLKQSLGVT